MSTIAEYVYSTLSGATDLHALVGDRIFPVVAPEAAALPYVTFLRVSSVPSETHDGGSTNRLDETQFQFTIVAQDYTAMEDIRNALRATLEDTAAPQNGSTSIDNIRESYEDDTEVFVTQIDATFFHST